MTKQKEKIINNSSRFNFIRCYYYFFTCLNNEEISDEKIILTEAQKEIKQKIKNQNQDGDIFYNIEYSGFDIAGNRYILKSEEAKNDKSNQETIIMKFVTAVFYFKDDTVLEIWSENGVYNNKTLDMTFKKNVKAIYEKSELNADQAEYSSSKSFLSISGKVKVIDAKGTMFADKLLFDIKKEIEYSFI